MKRYKRLILLGFLTALFCVVGLTGCAKALSVPQDVAIEDNTISWTKVENASNYIVDVSGKQYATSKTSYSFATLAEGDYIVKVKACDSKKEWKDSPWTEEIEFTKLYDSGLVYSLINGNTEYQVSKVGKARGDVVIEDTYKGKPVTAIAEKAFYGSGSLSGIVIGKNVKTIGAFAFNNCSFLTSVTIPDSVTFLGESAFQGCRKLETIKIPSGVKAIPDTAFRYCRALKSIDIPDTITSIGTSAFENCEALTSVTIPDSVKNIGDKAFVNARSLTQVDLGKGLETIGESAFLGATALREVKNGDAVTTFGKSCFENCVSLASYVFPETTVSIGNYAFRSCGSLSNVKIGVNCAYVGTGAFVNTELYKHKTDGVIYADTWAIGSDPGITKVTFKEGTVGIGNYAFEKCKISSLTIPAGIRYIGDYAFTESELLSVLSVGEDVVSIGRYAFAACPILGQGRISLGKKLETIGSYAFYNCPRFGNKEYTKYNPITIPKTVTSIGTYSFKDTSFWTDTKSGIVYVDNWAVGFVDDGTTSSVTIKDGTVGISNYAFYKWERLGNITICDTVKTIGMSAFYGCSNLTNINMSTYGDLTEIGDYLFYKCGSLLHVDIPVSVERIGYKAFYMSGVMTIDIPKWVTVIDASAFSGCSQLLKVNFAEDARLTTIGDFAFNNCSALVEMTVPGSVTSIGKKAFSKCTSLTKVTLNEGLTSLGNYAFNGCSALTEITLPESLTAISDKTFYKCISLQRVNFGSNVETIGAYAFYNCAALENVLLPATVTSIGSYAFKGCTGLDSIILGDKIANLGDHVFNGSKYLTIYCTATAKPDDWSARWNTSMRPVIWGVTLSEDGSHVVSFIYSENNVNYKTAKNGVSGPQRAGYEFDCWKAEIDGAERTFGANELGDIPDGTVLTAVWKEKLSESEQTVCPPPPEA